MLRRFIPAPAGNSARESASFAAQAVHPRACGELAFRQSLPPGSTGSSPRLRGTPGPRGGAVRAAAVHPRACGELETAERHHRPRCGSSPRLRGTLLEGRRHLPLPRFIPAPAGNSDARIRGGADVPVHPRACGELFRPIHSTSRTSGSSPRLRGTLFGRLESERQKRFIPAPAGNSSINNLAPVGSAVHPRACGELREPATVDIKIDGSSPRLRGTLLHNHRLFPYLRFIPAPAGNSSIRPPTPTPVHPRACGELISILEPTTPIIGSSPRLRGTRRNHGSRTIVGRFIPAPAGNSQVIADPNSINTVHPRACGELPNSSIGPRSLIGSSPRLRGTQQQPKGHSDADRFIPAPAGNSLRAPRPRAGHPVHPRACGELIIAGNCDPPHFGSSPRLRGTPLGAGDSADLGRFIPAPAGNSRRRSMRISSNPVHPRACGELRKPPITAATSTGSSPRLRGTQGGSSG